MAHDHQHEGPFGHVEPEEALPQPQEQIDAAQQSLADALRASFRVLKFIMIGLVIAFLFTGMFTVDQTEVAVVTRFGKREPTARPPGLHFALPRPIDDRITVQTAPKTIGIDAFWLTLTETQRGRKLSELNPRSKGLNPAIDGALLTGDGAIMHLRLEIQYYIEDAIKFVDNVSNESELMETVIRNATVAEAARATADVILKDSSRVATAVQNRAQETLDQLGTGIVLENVSAPESYYPLQAAGAFLGVTAAENKKIELINAAKSERAKKLNAAAGEAWKPLSNEIEKLEQVEDGPERDAIIGEIERMLAEEAAGEAGGKIQLAKSERDRIIADAQAEAQRFESLLPEYRRNPELLRRRFRQNMLTKLYQETGVTKWLLPKGAKQMVLWLTKDPQELAAAEKRRIEEKAKQR